MADGIPISPGAGATVATDDCGAAGHAQIEKLAYSADGVATPIPADARGLRTDHGVTTLGDGSKNVTTAGTRVTLASSQAAKWVTITAKLTNTGVVVVGGTTVVAAAGSRSGIPLTAGDTITLPVDDIADVNLDSTVSGEGVVYVWVG